MNTLIKSGTMLLAFLSPLLALAKEALSRILPKGKTYLASDTSIFRLAE